jgi:hypothetical protein
MATMASEQQDMKQLVDNPNNVSGASQNSKYDKNPFTSLGSVRALQFNLLRKKVSLIWEERKKIKGECQDQEAVSLNLPRLN